MPKKFATKVAGFWRRVEQTPNCWKWRGKVTTFYDWARFSWFLHFGEIPAGMSVLRRCGTFGCVRPDHLYLGDKRETARKAQSVQPPPIDLQTRLEQQTTRTASCWNWTGARWGFGYGKIQTGVNRRTDYTHRVAYKIYKGNIPQGMQVLHRCDNPACVNPEHLFLGTQNDNMQDMIQKGRAHFQGGVAAR